MDLIMDEYNIINNDHIKSVITGKSPICGGRLGRKEATGRGIGVIIHQVVQDLNKTTNTIKLEGFGNVGYHLTEYLNQLNENADEFFYINTISDHTGCYSIQLNIDYSKEDIINSLENLLNYQ